MFDVLCNFSCAWGANMRMKTVASRHDQFRALDPDLPLLAARAAAELDLLIQVGKGKQIKKVETDAVQALSSRLAHFQAFSPEKGQKSLYDPVSTDVFMKAYQETNKPVLKNITDLVAATHLLSDSLNKAKESQNNGSISDMLPVLRDFCIALSDYSAYKRQSALGVRSTPSYRK